MAAGIAFARYVLSFGAGRAHLTGSVVGDGAIFGDEFADRTGLAGDTLVVAGSRAPSRRPLAPGAAAHLAGLHLGPVAVLRREVLSRFTGLMALRAFCVCLRRTHRIDMFVTFAAGAHVALSVPYAAFRLLLLASLARGAVCTLSVG